MKNRIEYKTKFAVIEQRTRRVFELLEYEKITDAERQEALDLIAADVDLLAVTKASRETLLHLAAARGDVVILQKLIDAKANLGAQDHSGYTPLHIAAKHGKKECVLALIKAGADINTTTYFNNHQSPLHLACMENHPDCVQAFIDAGAALDAPNKRGRMPGHNAATAGSVACLRLLLAAGVDPRSRTMKHQTLLHCAAEAKTPDCLQYLMETEARHDLHARDADNYTPLHFAVEHNEESVRILLEAGADPHARTTSDCTPMHIAAYRYKDIPSEIIPMLVRAGADVNAHDNLGATPLFIAANRSIAAMQKLLDLGAHINARNGQNSTPLLNVIVTKADGIEVPFLLEAGASIWARNDADAVAKNWQSIETYAAKWGKRLQENHRPKIKKNVLRLVSVMPVENDKHIPEPREQVELLFRTLPHTEPLNKLYKECMGHDRPPEAKASLQQLRTKAQNSGVGL